MIDFFFGSSPFFFPYFLPPRRQDRHNMQPRKAKSLELGFRDPACKLQGTNSWRGKRPGSGMHASWEKKGLGRETTAKRTKEASERANQRLRLACAKRYLAASREGG